MKGGADYMAKKKSQLVCQHLENVSRTMLEEYQDIIRDFVRGRNGIYALYRRGKLYYVGLASSLLGRLKRHLKDRHGQTWDRFSVYLTIGPQYMKEIESVLLRISIPPGNKVKGKFIRSENLLPQVKRAYRERQREREIIIFGSRKRKKEPLARKRKKPKLKGRTPVLKEHLDKLKKKRLRGSVKGKTVRARVLKNGQISFDGERYNSPSRAAAVACGTRTRNGWRFWTYERAPGDWVPLSELRG